MDEEMLQRILQNFVAKGRNDMGQGDYDDMLSQTMHMSNHGGSDEDLEYLLSMIPQDRRDAMMEYSGGGPNIDPNMFNRQHRSSLNNVLRKFRK